MKTPIAILREKQRVTKYIRDTVAEYQKKLLLDKHDIDIRGETEKDGSYMEMTFRLPYLDPVLKWNPEKVIRDWQEDKIGDIKQAIIHELCHIITDPLYGCASDRYITKDNLERERETVTDHMAMIVKKTGI